MSLAAGSKLGLYEIVSLIGAGGMGEVYRARDTKLKRDVALKVLPDAFARDPERMARFQREAELLASLNHPNIAHLYGLEERALVMELVEGETLPCPLPVETALNYAKQISEALEYAHEKGVVHRDLKPANIKITPEGVVKVLDFGLAKAIDDPLPSTDPSNSPTLTIGATRVGMILGTAAYMSPEQASGHQADRRADIWSFGAVLYEMLAGKKAFAGESISDTLATVLKLDPDWDTLPRETPASIAKLVRRCLTKNRKQRLQAIGEARIALENPESDEVGATAPSQSRLSWVLAAAAGALAVGLASLAFAHFREKPPEAEVVRFEIDPPASGTTLAPGVSVSPDGRKVAFFAFGSLASRSLRLWIRSLDTQEARPIEFAFSSGNVLSLFWSADSRFLGFANAGKLYKIDVTGGPAQPLCDLPVARPGAGTLWTRDYKIVFDAGDGLRQVSTADCSSMPLTTVDRSRGETVHLPLSLLPDGHHFLYARRSAQAENSGLYLGSLDAKPEAQSGKRLLASQGSGRYAPSPDGNAYLLFVRATGSGRGVGGTLMAQPFDARKLEPVGEAMPVAERVGVFSVSTTGVLVYQSGFTNGAPLTNPTLFDRQGKALSMVAESARYFSAALSPDGKWLVGARADPGIWLYEFASGNNPRFTFPGLGINSQSLFPLWSQPDGSKILFERNGLGSGGLYQKASNLKGDEELLVKAPEGAIDLHPTNWSSDGNFVLLDFLNRDPKKGVDVWVLPMGGPKGEKDGASHEPIPVLSTESNEQGATFSPDGKWIAYTSNAIGQRDEIYVRPFDPASPGKAFGELHPISSSGGIGAHWCGKELFYQAPDANVMAVEVATTPAFKAGAATTVFKLPANATLQDVSADGRRFLVLVPAGGDAAQAAPYSVVVNWTAALKK